MATSLISGKSLIIKGLLLLYFFYVATLWLAGAFRLESKSGWIIALWLCVLTIPVYIYIFNKVFDKLQREDWVFLFLPFALWVFFTFVVMGGAKSLTNGVILEPALVVLITGIYFLIIPISQSFAGISRSVLSAGLGLLLAAAVLLVVYLVPAVGD